jgi:hypothetical protein
MNDMTLNYHLMHPGGDSGPEKTAPLSLTVRIEKGNGHEILSVEFASSGHGDLLGRVCSGKNVCAEGARHDRGRRRSIGNKGLD